MSLRSLLPFLLVPLFVVAQGCATASKVPSIKADELPAAKFRALNPRLIRVEVKNNRAVNQKAGNSSEVEKAVTDAVTSALKRGGFKVTDKAPHLLSISLDDYTGEGSADGECLKITGTLKAKWKSSVTIDGSACVTQTRGEGFAMAGDVSDSYTLGLKVVIEGLEKHQMELLRGN